MPAKRNPFHDIEAELIDLAQADARRWQKEAQLMIQVQDQALWQSEYPSYTAWVRSVAKRAGLHESNFWRALKAGRYYLECLASPSMHIRPHQQDGDSYQVMPDLDSTEMRASAESLELLEKISRHAPEDVRTDLFIKAARGNISRNKLREIWQAYRPAAEGTARGRLRKDEHPTGMKEVGTDVDRLTAAQIALAIKECQGLPFQPGASPYSLWEAKTQVAVRPGTTRHARLIDVVGIALPSKGEVLPVFHGIEIKVSKSDLENDQKLTEYEPFCDFMWLAVTNDLVSITETLVPENYGILTVEDGNLVAVRKAYQDDSRPDRTGELAKQLVVGFVKAKPS